MRTAVSTDTLRAVAARVEAGSTVAAEARRVAIPYRILRSALLAAGRRTRRPRGSAPRTVRLMTPAESNIIRLHQRRLSVRNIARRVGRSPAGVQVVIAAWRRGDITTHAN
jgi:hypothetical protein